VNRDYYQAILILGIILCVVRYIFFLVFYVPIICFGDFFHAHNIFKIKVKVLFEDSFSAI